MSGIERSILLAKSLQLRQVVLKAVKCRCWALCGTACRYAIDHNDTIIGQWRANGWVERFAGEPACDGDGGGVASRSVGRRHRWATTGQHEDQRQQRQQGRAESRHPSWPCMPFCSRHAPAHAAPPAHYAPARPAHHTRAPTNSDSDVSLSAGITPGQGSIAQSAAQV